MNLGKNIMILSLLPFSTKKNYPKPIIIFLNQNSEKAIQVLWATLLFLAYQKIEKRKTYVGG